MSLRENFKRQGNVHGIFMHKESSEQTNISTSTCNVYVFYFVWLSLSPTLYFSPRVHGSVLLSFFFPLFICWKRLIVVEILSYDYEMICNINSMKGD